MSFEEFFKKKRIELTAFEKGLPNLYFEFRAHYNDMGEKSFDHTKKYWFNKLRRSYPLPIELKTEKPKIENPIAEQTIIESLEETIKPPAPAKGFVPRFKAATIPKAQDPAQRLSDAEVSGQDTKDKPADPITKPGYQPRFKPGTNTAEPQIPEEKQEPGLQENQPVKPVYKPRFNPKNMPPKEPDA